jgi:hypothetical protein
VNVGELLDDLSTDGYKIYSDKIDFFGTQLMSLVMKYGIDISLDKMCEVDGWRWRCSETMRIRLL